MTQRTPWAVLRCKFNDDQSEAFPDFLRICQQFFTQPGGPSGAGYNAVQFFLDMSHGQLDLTRSKVSDWLQLDIPSNNTVGQAGIIALAKEAAANTGFDVSQYFGVIVFTNSTLGWSQGYRDPPGPAVASDWRRVDGRKFDGTLGPRGTGGGNGTETFGHEMGHGYGLGHSRRDGSDDDYRDRWDIMSALTADSAVDDKWDARGPGLNAWNMRSLGWLDESRVWKPGAAADFDETIQLRPLHARDLPGWLAAELPLNAGQSGVGPYLVEFRTKAGWDAAIPRSAVLVHRLLDPAPNRAQMTTFRNALTSCPAPTETRTSSQGICSRQAATMIPAFRS
jgi:M6 family metalloprotease-like protein